MKISSKLLVSFGLVMVLMLAINCWFCRDPRDVQQYLWDTRRI